MAYDKDIEELANKALTMPKYEAFDSLIDMAGVKDLFSEQMNSEADLIDSVAPQIKPMIESIYRTDVNRIEYEKWFRYRKAGFFDFRADVYLEAEDREYIIEVKNPTHTFRESLAGITQLMMYDVVLSRFEVEVKKIYLTSVIEPMIIEFIKDYNLDIDVILYNGTQTAHWDNTLTN